MSKYDKDTKFYWLQLKEDFFEDDAIEWLEEQKPNGRDYAYFYLKLCLKSLKSNGVLVRKVGKILIPYDNQKLAELTKMDFDTVTVAMELLKKIGLIQILENGEIYINQLENLIGSKSIGAFKKQQQRLLGGQKGDNCPPKIEIELEKEKEIEIEKEIDVAEITKCYEENIGLMTPATAELLFDYLKDMNKDLIIKAIKIASINNKRTGRYIQGILNDWSKKGFKTLLDVEQEQNSFKNKNEEKQEEYEYELTYTADDFTLEQYDRLMRGEMTKDEMIQILKEKKNV